MDSGTAIQIIIIFVLILLSAFFSSAETALTTVNKIRMKTLADEGNKKAAIVLKIIENSNKMLSAILIGNNIVNLSASSLATIVAMRILGDIGASVATGFLTLAVLIWGEITPKTVASVRAEKISLLYAIPIFYLMKILSPIIAITNSLSGGFMKLLRVDSNRSNEVITESELRTLVEVSKDDGVIETSEYELIDNVFDFGDAIAKDIMVPRIDTTFVNVTDSFSDIIKIFREDKYTRYPVYEDTTDNVIGLINVKDLLLWDNSMDFHVRRILREIHFTYEHKRISELFIEMQASSKNTAIVLDEYGATAGLISLEDILEELVGEIRDEYDEDEHEDIINISENEFLIDGNAKLEDINETLETTLSSEEYDSIAGYMLEAFDKIPTVNESLIVENFTITITKMDKNRIEQVKIQRNLQEPETLID